MTEIVASLCFDGNVLISSSLLQLLKGELKLQTLAPSQITAGKKWGDKKPKENLNRKAYITTYHFTSFLLPEMVQFLSLQVGGRLENYSHRTDMLPTLFSSYLKGKINQCRQIVVIDISFITCNVVAARSDYLLTQQ